MTLRCFLSGLSRSCLKRLVLCTALTLSLQGCQTLKNVQSQFAGGTYQTFDGKMIDAAQSRITPPVEETLYTTLLDKVKITDGEDEVGFNVSAKYNKEREAALRGLSARDLEMREFQARSVEELSGPGAAALNSYLSGIVDRLLDQWPHDRPEVSIVVIKSDEYDAEISSNNIIRLTTPVLLNADDEDEVAAVVAHELGHALFQHHNADDQAAIDNKSLMALTSYSSAILLDNSQSAATQNAAQALLFGGYGIYKLNDNILHNSWKRYQEDEADLLAVDLLYAAGYDWERAITMLERLTHEEKRETRRKNETVRQIDELNRSLTSPVDITTAFNNGLAELSGELSNLQSSLTADHAPADQRLREVKLYLQREYMRAGIPPAADQASLEKVVWEGPGFSAIKKSVYGERARILAERGEYDEARELALKALDGRDDTDPSARYVLYLARKHEGDIDKATYNLDMARQDSQAGLNIFTLLRDEYVNQEKWDDALDIWQKALIRFPKHITMDTYLPERISILTRAGRLIEAQTEVEFCVQNTASTYLKALCQNAIRPADEQVANIQPDNNPLAE